MKNSLDDLISIDTTMDSVKSKISTSKISDLIASGSAVSSTSNYVYTPSLTVDPSSVIGSTAIASDWVYGTSAIDTDTLMRGCELNRYNLTTTKNGEQLTVYGQRVFDELNLYANGTLTKDIVRYRCDIKTPLGKMVLSMIYGYVFPLSTSNSPVYVCDETHVAKVIDIGKEIIDYYNRVYELHETLMAKISILSSFSC